MHLALGIMEGVAAFWGGVESFLLVVLIVSVISVLLVLLKKNPAQKSSENDYAMMNKVLRQTLEEFSDKIDNSMKDTIDA